MKKSRLAIVHILSTLTTNRLDGKRVNTVHGTDAKERDEHVGELPAVRVTESAGHDLADKDATAGSSANDGRNGGALGGRVEVAKDGKEEGKKTTNDAAKDGSKEQQLPDFCGNGGEANDGKAQGHDPQEERLAVGHVDEVADDEGHGPADEEEAG